MEHGIDDTEAAILKKGGKSSVKHVGPLSGVLTVNVLARGVTPTSELVCVFPFPDGDAR